MRKNTPVTNKERELGDNTNILSTTDLKGQITYVNDDFINISGFDKKELLGQPHNIVRHPDMPPAAFENLWQYLKAGRSWMGLVKNRCKNGDYYWVDAFATPITADGKTVEYQSVRTKPSRAQIARAERYYQLLSAGKTPLALKRRPPSLQGRLLTAIGAAFVPPLVAVLAGAGTAISLAALAAGAAIAGIAIVTTLRPLTSAFEEARQVYDHPLMQLIYTGDMSEVGRLQLALKMLKSELAAVLGRVDDAAKQMEHTGEMLSASVLLTKQGIHHQDEQTAAVAAAMTELSSTAQAVARNTQQAADAAHAASDAADSGRQVVSRTVESINQLASEVEQSSRVIERLQQDSAGIGKVLDVIRGIAEQTNLLALNAAIEAARAGEQGRGFAVVADEVRTLASRTQSSTQEIQGMIQRLQGGAKEAVQTMERGRATARSSVEHAAEAGGALDAISSAVQTINDMNLQIASAAEQQSQVVEEIHGNVETITEVNELTVDGMQETASTSDKLAAMAGDLKRIAAQFRSRLAAGKAG